MRYIKSTFFTILLLLVGAISSFGQLKFHIASFGEDQFDLAARDERFKKIDGSGSLYAIIKVSGDDLKEYNFNFGNMNHLVEEHNGKLWVYVQKNAKMVTIMRKGYTTIDKYDLHTTIEAGKTYVMQLSAQGPVIYTQMVMFQVKPVDARATIMIRREGADTQEEVFGITDAEGRVANPLEYGTYTYRVMATNYHSTEGRITLNNQDETHVESVNLRSNGAVITLSVAQDAEIYVNGARKGVRSWKGLLKAGNYQVECRQVNHRPSSQNITVTEGKDEVVTLTPPTPITGRLSVNSSPLNAAIKVGGRVLGNTPKIIPDVLIGRHEIVLSREGYDDAAATVDVKEGETSNVNLTLTKATVSATPSVGGTPSASGGRTFTVNGVSFVMMPVEGGTFQMGVTSDDPNRRDEMPVHNVTLSSYHIGQTEVTQALWTAVMGSNPSDMKGDNLPVDYVSWKDCQMFITRLNKLTGQKFRLPTEAEWEYAARGGNKSKGYHYSGSNTLDDVAWYEYNSGRETHPVATKLPNELDIYDMSGNAVEWCQDWYDENYYTSSPGINPTGPSSGSYRVTRGSGAYDWGGGCRVSTRRDDPPKYRTQGVGLRLALSE